MNHLYDCRKVGQKCWPMKLWQNSAQQNQMVPPIPPVYTCHLGKHFWPCIDVANRCTLKKVKFLLWYCILAASVCQDSDSSISQKENPSSPASFRQFSEVHCLPFSHHYGLIDLSSMSFRLTFKKPLAFATDSCKCHKLSLGCGEKILSVLNLLPITFFGLHRALASHWRETFFSLYYPSLYKPLIWLPSVL